MSTYWPFILNVCVMIGLPLLLARWLQARRRPGWELFGMGALTFVLSQVGHIPFNWFVLRAADVQAADLETWTAVFLYAAFLGLSSGLFEEVARYLTYRYWATEARTWGRGLMLGAGHGGIEAMLVGLLAGINYVVMAGIQRGSFLAVVPVEQLALVQAQVAAVFELPWYDVLLGGLERAFALCLHLALSLLVMQAVLRGQRRWVAAAVAWHALANGVAVVLVLRVNAYVAEAALAVMALLSLGIIWALRAPEPVEPELAPLPPPQPIALTQPEASAEALERSRYS
ncbi:MAG: YhfC family intramembrane metalloprotease [Anaerolineales bacterium]|nr:YhfC family intramembrane metalloprotease [Anaerolineales bacterium]